MNHPPSGAWLSQIEGARTASELVRILRDYLAALSPQDRAHLPARLTDENLERTSDLQEWAVALAHADLKATGLPEAKDVLHQAAVIFAGAGSRLPRVAE